jgi:methionyl-tRNA formyltransferase
MLDFKTILFANDYVGLECLDFLVNNHSQDIEGIVVQEKFYEINNVYLSKLNLKIFVSEKSDESEIVAFIKEYEIDLIILSWWPKIITRNLISSSKLGAINFHPSLLPNNRGKHYNFWNIVEDVDFGVTIHFVDEKIDTGDILFQRKIEKTWEDTGKTLFGKAQKEILKLFTENYKKIRTGNFKRVKQNLNEGSFHYARELESASLIDLEKNYKAKELLNLLRARTFSPHPGCCFIDENQKYEIQIKIKKAK